MDQIKGLKLTLSLFLDRNRDQTAAIQIPAFQLEGAVEIKQTEAVGLQWVLE